LTGGESGSFAHEVRAAVRERRRRRRPVRFEPTKEGWAWHPTDDERWAGPYYLQTPTAGFDVFDRGLVVHPIGYEGSARLRVGVVADDGAAGWVEPEIERVTVTPGAVGLTMTTRSGRRLAARLTTEGDALVIRVEGADGTRLRAFVRSALAADTAWRDGAFRQPLRLTREEPFLARHSNTRLTDPLPPDRPGPELVLSVDAGGREIDLGPDDDRLGPIAVLGPEFAARDGGRLVLTVAGALAARPGAEVPPRGGARASIGVSEPAARLGFAGVPADLERQLGFAELNSLVPRSVHDGRSFLLHGRPGDGFGEVAHLHQSYQMHLVALASGETDLVRDDLLVHLGLVRDGVLDRSPAPGGGSHPYVSGYSEAHVLLAVHRYLMWTGDRGFLTCRVGDRSVLEHLVDIAATAASRRVGGLMPPCGWIDAWPEGVVAQAQSSCAWIVALRALSDVLGAADEPRSAALRRAEAGALADRVVETFLVEDGGHLAEHLYADGSVGGGDPDGAWVHTQIWAALAGLRGSDRGVRRVLRYRTPRGMPMCGPSALTGADLAAVTDPTGVMADEVSAVWCSSTWPELTHLLAAELARAGHPDDALALVRDQLPAAVHRRDPATVPWVYPEKFLEPSGEPWLSTWAGDPTLIEVFLRGFLGLVPTWNGLRVSPELPAELAGLEATVLWRGAPVRVVVEPRAGRSATSPVLVPPPDTRRERTVVVRG